MQSWTAFSEPAHVNPSGPTHVSSHRGFLWDCASGAARVQYNNINDYLCDLLIYC